MPQEIMRPDYAKDGIPKAKSPMLPWVIEVKKEEDIVGMREAGRVARYESKHGDTQKDWQGDGRVGSDGIQRDCGVFLHGCVVRAPACTPRAVLRTQRTRLLLHEEKHVFVVVVSCSSSLPPALCSLAAADIYRSCRWALEEELKNGSIGHFPCADTIPMQLLPPRSFVGTSPV